MAVRVQPPSANPVQYRVPGPRLASGGQDRAVPLRQQSLAAELAALRQEGEIPTTEQSLFEAINAGFDKWHEGALRVDEMNAAEAERKAEDLRHEEKLKADFYKEALRFQEKGQAGEGKAKKTLLQEETEQWAKSVVGKRTSFWATPRLRVDGRGDIGILATGSNDKARAEDAAANAYLGTRLTAANLEKNPARFGAALSQAISNNLNHDILRVNFPILKPDNKDNIRITGGVDLLNTLGSNVNNPDEYRRSTGGALVPDPKNPTKFIDTGQLEKNITWRGAMAPMLTRSLASAEFDRLLGSTAATGNTLPDSLGAALNAWQHFNSTREKREYTEYETLIESLFSRFGGAMWDGVKGAGKLAGGALLAPVGLAGRFIKDRIPGPRLKPDRPIGPQPAELSAPSKPAEKAPRLETPPNDIVWSFTKSGPQVLEIDEMGRKANQVRRGKDISVLDFLHTENTPETREKVFNALTAKQREAIFGQFLGETAEETFNNLLSIGDE